MFQFHPDVAEADQLLLDFVLVLRILNAAPIQAVVLLKEVVPARKFHHVGELILQATVLVHPISSVA